MYDHVLNNQVVFLPSKTHTLTKIVLKFNREQSNRKISEGKLADNKNDKVTDKKL